MGDRRLFKYYLVFSLLVLFTAGAVVYTLSLASSSNKDQTTQDKVVEASSKLEGYIAKNNQLPTNLDDAGINNIPSTLTYKKISDTKYRLCANYTTASSGFSGGWTSIFTGALSSLHSTSSLASNIGYLDVYNLAYNHQKGQNCQTVKPIDLTSSNVSSSSAQALSSQSSSDESLITAKCGNAGPNFELKDEATVKSVDSGQGIITLDTTKAKITDKNPAALSSLGSIKYDSLTRVYLASCKPGVTADVDSLKAGTTITVYLYDHSGDYADQLEL